MQIAGFDEKVDKSNAQADIDLNELTTTGFYRATNSMTNAPSGASGTDNVIVSRSGVAVSQIFINSANGRMWTRSGILDLGVFTWSAWVKAVGFDELVAYAEPSPAVQNRYDRNTILPLVHNGVLVMGAKYPAKITAQVIMFLPLPADVAVGDKVTFLNDEESWAGPVGSRLIVKRQETSTLIQGFDELELDTNVGEISLTCTSKTGGIVRWVIS
jgi:hypothetical protein